VGFDDNPIFLIDPNGTSTDGYYKDGKFIGYDEKGDNGAFHELRSDAPENVFYNESNRQDIVNSTVAKQFIETTVFLEHYKHPEIDEINKQFSAAGLIIADDVTGGGIANDVLLLPLALSIVYQAVVVKDRLDEITYVTYTKTHPSSDLVYSGRSSGIGDPDKIVRVRDYRHPQLKSEGFDDAELDKYANGIYGYLAHRGREQQLIDSHGGARKDGGTSRNIPRGVSKVNPLGRLYHYMSDLRFGPIHGYSGY